MHRLYSPSPIISGDKIIIDNKEQVHHARDVLRLKRGEEITVFDNRGNEYYSVLEELLPASIVLKVKVKKGPVIKPSKVKITVACAIPKASHMDDIVDKLTQLGVDGIIPMETERIVVKLDKHKKILRQERWKKIAQSASQQSQRSSLPILYAVTDIRTVIADAGDFDLKLIPTLAGERKTIREILDKYKPKNILVLVGPEGDFSPQELESAKEAGFIAVSLGDLVLRVETAAVAAASFIRLYYDKS